MHILTTVLSLVLIAAPVLVVPAAAQITPGSVASGQLSLPSDHRYERYDPTAATYGKVEASQVPALIKQNASIYDRTAKQWVYRPGQGLNPMYSSSGATSGTTGGTTSAPAGSGWQRVHGQVESLQGNAMTFRADDGQLLTVDLGPVSASVRQALKQGEGATVIGSASGTQFRAQYVQQDSSDPKHGGRIAGGAPAASPQTGGPDDKSWQRIHGRVQSVQGSQLVLKADDDRTVNVNMSEVDAGVQKALKPGERVTVIGTYRGNQNTLAARYVQQER